MEGQEIHNTVVRSYKNIINSYARDIVSWMLAGDNDRAMLRREHLKRILDEFREDVKKDDELQYQIKKYELFLIGSED